MAERSSGSGLANLVVAGIGSVYIVRFVQQLRHRAVNPDVDDPGRRYVRLLPAIPTLYAILLVLASIALFFSTDPVLAIFGTVAGALVGLVVALVVAAALWAVAEMRRRDSKYVICEADYADAPRQIKSTMRRIYRSSRSLKDGAAYKQEIFGDLGLDRLVYTTAKRAVVSSELAGATRDLRPNAKSSDRALMEQANAQVKAISEELAAVEETLMRGMKTADTLSRKLSEPDRIRAAAQSRAEAAVAYEDRHHRARTKLEDATARASEGMELGHADLEDRVTAVAAGYDEATAASAAALGETSGAPDADAGVRSDDAARNAVKRAAKSGASKAAKLSSDTAKTGVRKIRDRD